MTMFGSQKLGIGQGRGGRDGKEEGDDTRQESKGRGATRRGWGRKREGMQRSRKKNLGTTLFFFLGLTFCTKKLKEPLSFFIFLTFHQTPILLVIYRIFNFSIQQIQNNATKHFIKHELCACLKTSQLHAVLTTNTSELT